MIVSFSADEQHEIKGLAQRRSELSRSVGLKDRNRSGRSPLEVYLVGLWAEAAVGRLFGLEPRIDGKPDPGFDFELAIGATIDVKATMSPKGGLFRDPSRHFRADILVLCFPAPDGVKIAGWVWRSEFERKATKRQLRSNQPPLLYLYQSSLRPIEELMAIANPGKSKVWS